MVLIASCHVAMEPPRRSGVSFMTSVVGFGVSPFAQARLDEALSLAVGLGVYGTADTG